jgi:hypothetical protein
MVDDRPGWFSSEMIHFGWKDVGPFGSMASAHRCLFGRRRLCWRLGQGHLDRSGGRLSVYDPSGPS